MSGTGTFHDPFTVDDDVIVISSDEEPEEEPGEEPEEEPEEESNQSNGMDTGADDPAQSFRGEALNDTLSILKDILKDKGGVAVVTALRNLEMYPADRARMCAEVERQMRAVFGGAKNPDAKEITRKRVHECCAIINRVVYGNFLDCIPYIVRLNKKGTSRKAGHCRPGFTRGGKRVPPEIKFNPWIIQQHIRVVDGEIRHRRCNGLVCKDTVAIIASVLMHEFVHLIFHFFLSKALRKDRTSRMYAPHGTAFMDIARNLYGHTDCKVALTGEAVVTSNSITHDTADLLGLHVTFTFKGHSAPTRGVIIMANPRRAKVRLLEKAQECDISYPFLQRSVSLK